MPPRSFSSGLASLRVEPERLIDDTSSSANIETDRNRDPGSAAHSLRASHEPAAGRAGIALSNHDQPLAGTVTPILLQGFASMTHTRRQRAVLMQLPVALTALTALFNPTYAQNAPIAPPANATAMTNGSGWRCDHGYRRDVESCVHVEVPANAYLTGSTYGRGWTCERGFRIRDDSCTAIELPANAHLDYSGNDWECNRPYRRLLRSCVLVVSELK